MGYLGIDYGSGLSNRDPETGIRYGVISQHSVSQAWCDSSEPDYGEATCPKCGNVAREYDETVEHGDKAGNWECAKYESADWMCESCEYVFGGESAFGDEPQGWSFEGDGYKLTDCLDSDVFVLASPFYTFAQFCSPCVPGAGNLDNAMPDGVKTFCLGHDWFEDEVAPYPVYSVKTDELVTTTTVNPQFDMTNAREGDA